MTQTKQPPEKPGRFTRSGDLDFYNGRRPRSSLDGATPDHAYFAPLQPHGSLTPAENKTWSTRKICSDNRH